MIVGDMLVPQTIIDGCRLEIDEPRGVIYVHGADGTTLLRISGLPPIPEDAHMIDIDARKTAIAYNHTLVKVELP
jgi:hypothetical protein